ncbi:MAG: hypothetical protein M1820_010298 [Bogoriella megaspora]|nr:MAG: hypothetical protein M1820_010298 [Bogoriella megaspora]
MATNNAQTNSDHSSMTDRAETSEPEQGPGNNASAAPKSGGGSPNRYQNDGIKNEKSASSITPSSAAAPIRQFAVATSASTSPRNSPHSSRNPSPTRPTPKPEMLNTAKGMKSRNGSHEMSPSRPSVSAGPHQTVPSAAAIQRALSSAAAPPLQQIAVPDPQTKLPKPQKTTGSVSMTSEATQPHWPVSPRLKSPSPSAGSRRNSLLNPATQIPRKSDSASAPVTPSIVVQRSTPGSNTPTTASSTGTEPLSAQSDESYPTPPKTSKSMLETVQESQSPGKTELQGGISERQVFISRRPNRHLKLTYSKRNLSGRSAPIVPEDDRPPTISEDSTEESGEKISRFGESESESGGNRSDGRGRRPGQNSQGSQRPKTNSTQKPYAQLAPTRSRTGQENSGNMTVETETVSSVPQATLSGGSERSGSNRADGAQGSLRLKPSTETIRPKKERKKTSRKQPSLQSGTASSKADIFEAKVASAVDEADSSDSDETFVYESNPPEPHHRPRNHSRTPSIASIASQVDHRGASRTIGDALGGHRIAGKRSMKFSSAFNDVDGADGRNDGTVRSGNLRSAGSSGTHLHHHIGRHGRPSGAQTPLLDGESPKTAAKIARSRPSSRPTSATQNIFPHRSKKSSEAFDIDVEGADDERTPLIGTVRTPRNRGQRPRPGSASLRQMDYYQHRQRSWIARFAGCIIIAVMMILVIIGVFGFLFSTTKPLYDVSIREIQNVLASEQELMLDLLVEAVNPNIMQVQITDMDINLFAKSKHIGSEPPSDPESTRHRSHWRRFDADSLVSNDDNWSKRPSRQSEVASGWPPFWGDPHDGADHGTDPMPDPSGDSSTMLLGRIFHFDSGLQFDGTPLKRELKQSVGELRLAKPGNKTEAGGSARWEKVLNYPFELIVRGVLKYQLPLTGKPKTVAIGRSVVVHPEEGVDDMGRMRVEPGGWRLGAGPGPRIKEDLERVRSTDSSRMDYSHVLPKKSEVATTDLT